MNPFCENPHFKISVVEVYKNTILVPKESIDFENNAILSYQTMTQVNHIETQKGVKIYDNFHDHSYFFKDFKPSTRDLFNYIHLKLQENTDYIRLNMEVVCKNTEMSKTSFYRAIKQLKEFLIISDKKINEYWVNPYIMFKGNRLKFYQQNYKNQIEIVAKKEIK